MNKIKEFCLYFLYEGESTADVISSYCPFKTTKQSIINFLGELRRVGFVGRMKKKRSGRKGEQQSYYLKPNGIKFVKSKKLDEKFK